MKSRVFHGIHKRGVARQGFETYKGEVGFWGGIYHFVQDGWGQLNPK
jgi:hypothetical protein